MPTVTQRAEIDMTGYNVGNHPATQGEIAIRWALLTYLDDRLVSRENLRDVVWPETPVDARMAEVRDHIQGRGFTWDAFSSDVDLIKNLAAQIWTPEVVAARNSFLASLVQADTPANGAAAG